MNSNLTKALGKTKKIMLVFLIIFSVITLVINMAINIFGVLGFGSSKDINHKFKTQDIKIKQLEEQIKIQEYNVRLFAQDQTAIMINVLSILSNQTQSIKDLKRMAEIQIMSTDDSHSAPATNGVNLLENVRFFDVFAEFPHLIWRKSDE